MSGWQRKRACVSGAVVALLLTAARSRAEEEPAAKITEYGRYEVTVVRVVPPDGDDKSPRIQIKDRRHRATTRLIPCRVGEAWGFRVQWSNLPRDREYTLRNETTHPPLELPDGSVAKNHTEVITIAANEIPDPLIISWMFLEEYPYELVPGEWTHSVFIDGKKVASMTFRVQRDE